MSTQVGLLSQWRDLMRSWGFTVLEAGGWQTRDAEPGTAYDPSRMFLEHHDASTPLSGNWGALGYVTANKLAQLVYSRDGQAMLVAAGVTWHAGVGGPFMDIPANQGNRYSMAVEVANSGSEPYSPALTRLIIAGEAAWCIVMKRNADRVRGHKEWATPAGRKSDPSVNMTTRRADVAAYLNNQGDDVLTTDQNIMLTQIHQVLFSGSDGTPREYTVYQRSNRIELMTADIQTALTNALPKILSGADVDEKALAVALAPLVAAPLVAAVVSELSEVDGIDPTEVEAAAERAVRRVLGGLDSVPV